MGFRSSRAPASKLSSDKPIPVRPNVHGSSTYVKTKMGRIPISLSKKRDLCTATEFGKTGGKTDTEEEQGKLIQRKYGREGPEEETQDTKDVWGTQAQHQMATKGDEQNNRQDGPKEEDNTNEGPAGEEGDGRASQNKKDYNRSEDPATQKEQGETEV